MIAFASAVLCLVLIRQKDFVQGGPSGGSSGRDRSATQGSGEQQVAQAGAHRGQHIATGHHEPVVHGGTHVAGAHAGAPADEDGSGTRA